MTRHFVWMLFATMSGEAVAQQSVGGKTLASYEQGKQSEESVALLAKPVTVGLNRVSVSRALDAVAVSAKVRIAYIPKVVDATGKMVTLATTKMPLESVLREILIGTSLQLRVLPGGRLTVVEKTADAQSESRVDGEISGRVVDSASGRGLRGVAVTVQGTKFSVLTDDSGAFTLRGISAGARVIAVKLLGYRSVTRSITVDHGQIATVRVELTPTATALSGVVTTATGRQRKLEVGNDITTINVDSVMKVMPVATLTDLLKTRVPGLVVSPTSGAPGAPSRVRIRGVGSINATNDPIVIVDGVRKYAAQIERSGNMVSGRNVENRSADQSDQYVPSPLDQIDPNSIETVEVLKGPSAVALYGTDAANGIIVITTRRGRSGQRRWDASATLGQTTMPGKWPMNYWAYGKKRDFIAPQAGGYQCSALEANSVPRAPFFYTTPCEVDSVVAYQILNDPHTTVFGRGSEQNYRASLSGGVGGLTYAFAGSVTHELGLSKMPDADVEILKSTGGPVPKWQRRPQALDRQNGSANLTTEFGSNTTVSFTTALGRTFSSTTPLDRGIYVATRLPPNGFIFTSLEGQSSTAGAGSGLLLTIPDFRNRLTSRTLNAINSVDVRGQPSSFFSYFTTAGVDATSRLDHSTLERGALTCPANGCFDVRSTGFFDVGQGTTLVQTLRGGATVPLGFGRWLSLQTTAGGDYSRTSTNDLIRNAASIPDGATSGNGALEQRSDQRSDDRTQAGVYVETRIGLANRVFIPMAIRMDAGSGLGSSVRPKFPKLSLSYVVSDEPVFRAIPMIGKLQSLRIRTGYGVSGVQPGVVDKLRTYYSETIAIDGIDRNAISVSGFGNSVLRPERSTEWEGGFDTEALGGRVSTVFTWYRKRTLDLLTDIDVPGSVNGGGTQRTNLGTVVNIGTEVTITAIVLDQRNVGWTVTAGGASNRNRLVTLGKEGAALLGMVRDGIETRYVEGYPLNGQWARPLIGFSDLNGDGWITDGGIGGNETPVEIQLSPVPVFLGAPDPDYTVNMNSLLRAFGFTIGASMSYQDGITQANTALLGTGTSRAENDPGTPLLTQAYLAAAGTNCMGQGDRVCSNIGITQTVSSLRFDALSINCIVPEALIRTLLPGRSLRISLQGKNLGLWTNYRGKDPNVNSAMSEVLRDNGALPTPRVWQFLVGIN